MATDWVTAGRSIGACDGFLDGETFAFGRENARCENYRLANDERYDGSVNRSRRRFVLRAGDWRDERTYGSEAGDSKERRSEPRKDERARRFGYYGRPDAARNRRRRGYFAAATKTSGDVKPHCALFSPIGARRLQ